MRPTLCLLTCLLFCISPSAAKASERPNVILILSDDHNYNALGCSGNDAIRTPNLDRLAAEGVYFDRCFTPNPICSPARAAIYTGQDSWNSSVTFNGKPIPEGTPTLPHLLAGAGYETCFIGKWHNDGKPWTRGYTTGKRCWAGGKFDHFELALTEFGNDDPEDRKTAEAYSTTVFSDDAVEYLNGKHEQPFLMVLAYTVGHDVFKAPPGYEGKYDPAEVPLPKNFMPKPPFRQFTPTIRDETVLAFPRTESEVREATAEYYAMFEHLDANVGRLMTALDENQLTDNTVVIFCSAKGMSMGSHGIIGKQTMYEEGIRTSLIVRHPNLKPATRRNSNLVTTTDLLPTICEAAGVAIPAVVDGKSLLGLYDGSREGREKIFCSYHDPRRATITRTIRTRRHKLIQHLVTGERQLFDLEKDPHELDNLVDDPEFEPLATRLQLELLDWRMGTHEK